MADSSGDALKHDLQRQRAKQVSCLQALTNKKARAVLYRAGFKILAA